MALSGNELHVSSNIKQIGVFCSFYPGFLHLLVKTHMNKHLPGVTKVPCFLEALKGTNKNLQTTRDLLETPGANVFSILY